VSCTPLAKGWDLSCPRAGPGLGIPIPPSRPGLFPANQTPTANKCDCGREIIARRPPRSLRVLPLSEKFRPGAAVQAAGTHPELPRFAIGVRVEASQTVALLRRSRGASESRRPIKCAGCPGLSGGRGPGAGRHSRSRFPLTGRRPTAFGCSFAVWLPPFNAHR
jgi:hypothetical protein